MSSNLLANSVVLTSSLQLWYIIYNVAKNAQLLCALLVAVGILTMVAVVTAVMVVEGRREKWRIILTQNVMPSEKQSAKH